MLRPGLPPGPPGSHASPVTIHLRGAARLAPPGRPAPAHPLEKEGKQADEQQVKLRTLAKLHMASVLTSITPALDPLTTTKTTPEQLVTLTTTVFFHYGKQVRAILSFPCSALHLLPTPLGVST